MSQCGIALLYHNRLLEDAGRLIANLLSWVGIEQISHIWRRRLHRRTLNPGRMTLSRCRVPTDEVAASYVEGEVLWISCGAPPKGFALLDAIVDAISPDVRRDYAPGDIFITVGPHRHYASDLVERRKAKRADATLSVQFFGYSVALREDEFEQAVFDLPLMKQYRRELEEIAGPLSPFCVWSY